jgi:hypothetical protein
LDVENLTKRKKMSVLLSLLKNDPAALYKKEIAQLVAMCGDGKLTDGSECCAELREYLHIAKSEHLFAYADACLAEKFEKGGSVLQDVVNELGRRLEYTVEDGLYQGKSNATGNDGLWLDGSGHTIVVEVKTTDAYTINLDTVAKYRNQLIDAKKIPPSSSILLVVGRKDTGGWEEQVRGSRHAWDVRIIGVEALKQLVSLKENSESASVEKIHELLIPFEYTRLDRIIGIAFTVAEDAAAALEDEASDEVEQVQDATKVHQQTSADIIGALRTSIVEKLGISHPPLVKKSRALFWSADKTVRAAITVSKKYSDGHYWYAYHTEWDKFLSQGATGLFVLGCVGSDEAFAIPYEWMHSKLDTLNVSENKITKRKHYQVSVYPKSNGQLCLRLNTGVDEPLESFKMSV